MYTAKVTITTNNAHAFCIASHYLSINSLLNKTEQFLSEKVSATNVYDLFLLADKLELGTLRKSCSKYAAENCKTALKDNRINTYSLEDLKLLINEANGQVDVSAVREASFECLIGWVEYDPSNRSASLPALLRSLPLNKLSSQFLIEVVATQDLIVESLICARLLIDAFKEAFKALQQPNKSYRLYCFGGKDENHADQSSVSILNIFTNTWTTTTPMSMARSNFGGAMLGKKIYLCGGGYRYVGDNGNTVFSDILEVFDCPTNTIKQLRPMPEPRAYSAAASLNEFIYVCGGRIPGTAAGSSMLRYNTETDQWEEVKPMQYARESHQLITCKDRLYAIAGLKGMSVESYDPTTDQWTTMASAQHAHAWAGATVHDGKIYVCSHKGFEVYSPDTDTWQTLTPLNDFRGRTLVSINGKLWVFGGSTDVDKGSSSVFSYDIITGNWTQEADMDVSRAYFCSFVIPN